MADEDADKKPEEVTEEVQATEPEVTEAEQTEAPEAPETKEEPSQEETESEQPEATAEEQGEEEAPQQMSRRKAKRLEKLESLVQRLKNDGQPNAPKTDPFDSRKFLDDNNQIDLDELNRQSNEFAQQQYSAGLEQAKAIQFQTRLDIDAPRVEEKYPIFNQQSPEFNPAVASAINEWYLSTVGFDPKTGWVQNGNVRYADFVEGIMELVENTAGVKSSASVKNIAQQAATTGLRPGGTSEQPMDLSKDPSQMSTEELEAAIAATMPLRDSRGRFIKQT